MNEEPGDVQAYCSLNAILMIRLIRTRWAGHVARMGDTRVAYRTLVGRPDGKKTLGRIGVDGDNIKIRFQEVGLRSMEWIDLAQDRERWRAVVDAVMNFPVP